jgi:hypothetical protein
MATMATVATVAAVCAALLLSIPRSVAGRPMRPAVPRGAIPLISAAILIIATVIGVSCRLYLESAPNLARLTCRAYLLVVAAFMSTIVALATTAIASRTRVRAASTRHDWRAAIHGRHCTRALRKCLFHLKGWRGLNQAAIIIYGL